MKELTQTLRLTPSEIPDRIYGVHNWGAGYFGVSELGCLTVHPTRNPLFTVTERIAMLQKVCAPFPNVRVEAFEGLLIEFCKNVGARVIVRGLRAGRRPGEKLFFGDTAATLLEKSKQSLLFIASEVAR